MSLPQGTHINSSDGAITLPNQPAPINRTVSQPTALGSSPEETFLNTFKPPQSQGQIAEQLRVQSQGQIDALNKVYDDQINAAKQTGNERLNIDNATSVLSGLMGSTEAGTSRTKTLETNDKEQQAINNKRALDLSSVYSKISNDARTEAAQQLKDATASAESIVTRRKAVQENAINNLKLMASGGLVDFNAFKSNPANADVYKHAIDAVGSEDALRGLFALNRPKEQLVGTPQRAGDHFIQAYQNPITGKVSYDTVNIPGGIPVNYNSFQKMGDNIVAIPDGWDGDVTKLKTIIGQPSQEDQLRIQGLQLDNQKKRQDLSGSSPGENTQLYNGLSAHTSTAVRARVNKYASDNTIQNFSTVQDGYNFATSLKSDTKNPADDQALIYSLAKALDPGSVVREGEYATAQKYAQSWVAAYGKGVSQALLGNGFLSKTARDNIKTTITEKYNSQKRSYDQTRGSYVEGINALTGRKDGEKFITEYQTPDQGSGTGGGITVKDPAGGVHSFPDQKSADAFKKAAGIQ